MAVQQNLFNFEDYQIAGVKRVKKRVRYKTPTYKKSYTFWHINPITEEMQYNGDEKHIFRIRILQRIYSLIYGYCGINPFIRREKIYKENLTVWIEDMQAEITNTEMLSIKDRIKIHIKLLRLLKQGYEVDDALKQIKERE